MTHEEFLKLQRGDIVSPRPSEPYVVSEIRAEGAIVVRTIEVRDPGTIRVLHAQRGLDVLEKAGLAGLMAGDVIQQHGHGALSYIVAGNDGGASVTAVTTTMLTTGTQWSLVKGSASGPAWRPPEAT
ncbi:MAG TPA: hypothetical protein PKV98_01760 [Burkholderiaceae bacterium]|nr:hypothetical protein [Burkholderiaceae bacterium]